MSIRDKVLLTLFGLVAFVIFLLSHNQRIQAKAFPTTPEHLYHIPITEFVEGWDIPLVDMTNDEKEVACRLSRECSTLAEAVVYEARSESMLGQYAVAEVILNRVASKRWPNTIRQVVYQPYQFEYVVNKHLQRKPDKKDWTTAYIVAYNVKHELVEPITGSDHYLNPKVVKRMPKWTRHYRYVMTIGNHTFYASN